MVKNDDLGVELKNKWILFDSNLPSSVDEISTKDIICYHPSIVEDVYSKNITIKKFNFGRIETKVGMFNENTQKIVLSNFNDEVKIEISNNLSDF